MLYTELAPTLKGQGSRLTFIFLPLLLPAYLPTFLPPLPTLTPHLEPNPVTTQSQLKVSPLRSYSSMCECRAENQGSQPWRKTVTVARVIRCMTTNTRTAGPAIPPGF